MNFSTIDYCLLPIAYLSFIGIAINIWRDTSGTGGGGPGALALQDRANAFILDRSGAFIFTRV
jgi:hypothetical protein